ncbi:hypothetical protein AGLY_006959 [Aphis glycines]|uniref:Uncharacterized protein n=1 Tax=Aphis glycines TaxID=307491 RepID=A0A6G0TQ62_APHGL|nr:hypothetical protein AGLY_006959 [Aphis glycines]
MLQSNKDAITAFDIAFPVPDSSFGTLRSLLTPSPDTRIGRRSTLSFPVISGNILPSQCTVRGQSVSNLNSMSSSLQLSEENKSTVSGTDSSCVKKFNTKFSISFSSNSFRENSKFLRNHVTIHCRFYINIPRRKRICEQYNNVETCASNIVILLDSNKSHKPFQVILFRFSYQTTKSFYNLKTLPVEYNTLVYTSILKSKHENMLALITNERVDYGKWKMNGSSAKNVINNKKKIQLRTITETWVIWSLENVWNVLKLRFRVDLIEILICNV